MKTKLLGITLFILTLGVVVYYPQLMARNIEVNPPVSQHITLNKPRVDVVFVLDTTGSMSGLIQTAKEKIWSIATTMASAQPTPEIRIGELVSGWFWRTADALGAWRRERPR